MIATNIPKHLVVGARTGFLSALGDGVNEDYKKFTQEVPMKSALQQLTDLGAGSMPVEDTGQAAAKDFVEKALELSVKDWSVTRWVSQNAMDDDQTGKIKDKAKDAAENFKVHISNMAFDALDKGESTATYGACYDGLSFFNDAHLTAGAKYQTAQDNKKSLTLSIDNFETVRVAGSAFLNEVGEPFGYSHSLIVVNPADERLAGQIANNPMIAGTVNETNPYAGVVSFVMSHKITSGDWKVLDISRTAKPLILAMRLSPKLQDAWFDPNAPDGGRYYFKYRARYNMFYGSPYLAIQGK